MAFEFRPPRGSPGARDDGEVVEHDRRVLDEHRIRQIRRIGKPSHLASKGAQACLVGGVLLYRACVVDRFPRDVGQLAAAD
jgi:hypothetical protein